MRRSRTRRTTLKIAFAFMILIILAATLVLVLFMQKQKMQTSSETEAAQAAAGDPAATVRQLENTLDALDAAGVAACFDSASQDTVKTELNNVLGQYGNAVKLMQFAVNFSFQVNDITYADAEHCTVSSDTSVSLPGTEKQTSLELPMTIENGKWVIDLTGHPETFAQLEALF